MPSLFFFSGSIVSRFIDDLAVVTVIVIDYSNNDASVTAFPVQLIWMAVPLVASGSVDTGLEHPLSLLTIRRLK